MMPDELADLPSYAPDERAKKRILEIQRPPVTVDKPIRFRVAMTRPGTVRKHYPRKARKARRFDNRNPTFY